MYAPVLYRGGVVSIQVIHRPVLGGGPREGSVIVQGLGSRHR